MNVSGHTSACVSSSVQTQIPSTSRFIFSLISSVSTIPVHDEKTRSSLAIAYLETNRFRLYSIGSAIPTTVPIEDEWIAWAYAEPREPPPRIRIRGLLPGFPEPGSGGEGEIVGLLSEGDLCSIFLRMEVIWFAEWGVGGASSLSVGCLCQLAND